VRAYGHQHRNCLVIPGGGCITTHGDPEYHGKCNYVWSSRCIAICITKNKDKRFYGPRPKSYPEFFGVLDKAKNGNIDGRCRLLPLVADTDSQRRFAPKFQLISADPVAKKYRETPPIFPACRTHSLKRLKKHQTRTSNPKDRSHSVNWDF